MIVKNTSDRWYARGNKVFPPRSEIGPIQVTNRDGFGLKTVKFLEVTELPEQDLNDLTVSELKEMLDENDIDYKSTDRKQGLIDKLGG